MKTQLIILDRDGVINHDSPNYIKSPKEWRPIPGSLEAITELTQAGFTIVVITNQSGVGRGYFSCATLDMIHEKMMRAVKTAGGEISKIYYCPHTPDDHCHCRKPKPGMIEQVKKDFDVDLNQAFLVGDSLKDILLGQTAGCQCLLVKTGNGKIVIAENKNHLQGVIITDNLAQAARWILDK